MALMNDPNRPPGERPVFQYDPTRGAARPAQPAAPAPPARPAQPAAPAPPARPAPPRPFAALGPPPVFQYDPARGAARPAAPAPQQAMAAPARPRYDSAGIDFGASALAAQRRAAEPQVVDRMARRSAADEFSAIHEGLAPPRAFDAAGGRLRGRADAFNITNPRSRERELVELATRTAGDSRLKGFTGARNAIIAQIMGQLDAGNAASLEGQRQAGAAGLGLQDFAQRTGEQELERRGTRLRDQFLDEGATRLAALNNEADADLFALGEELRLKAALGKTAKTGADAAAIKRADNLRKESTERYPDDQVAADLATMEAIINEGADLRGLPAGERALQGVVGPVRDQFNARGFFRDAYEALTTGSQGATTRLGHDVNPLDLRVVEDDPFLVDVSQFFSHRDNEIYVVEAPDGTQRVIRPRQGAPSRAELLRAQQLARTNLERRAPRRQETE